MSQKSYQSSGRPPTDEQLIVDLVRLGLGGDAHSIRQLARKTLRSRKTERSDAFREQLGSLLVGKGASALRGAQLASPVEPESRLPLGEVDEAPLGETPILPPGCTSRLEDLIEARQQAATLASAGIDPPRTVLLTGPPGVGKSMTARYLASRLELPLITVELSALMSSFLGKTGQNLRRLLDYARDAHCVVFLDEFDAVAKRRDDLTDIGELKRLVNLLLLELDRWPPSALLLAATNHPQLLDPAVGRRFDLIVDLPLPGLEERHAILERALAGITSGDAPDPSIVAACAIAFEGASGADLERAVGEAGRTAVLSKRSLGSAIAEVALSPLRDSAATGDLRRESRRRRAAFAALASEEAGMTQRQIAELLGVSHPTVGKLIRAWKRDQLGAEEAEGSAA